MVNSIVNLTSDIYFIVNHIINVYMYIMIELMVHDIENVTTI